MHIVLINQFYPPCQAPTGCLLADLAHVLRERGHQVTVVASTGSYGPAAETGPVDDGQVTVQRVGTVRPHRNGLAAKGLGYARYVAGAYKALQAMTPSPDLMVCMTTPPFCGLVARHYGRRHGVPYLLWCMDLYPEALRAGGLLSTHNPLYRVLLRFARKEREDALHVIALGPDMAETIRRVAPRACVTEIPAWPQSRAVDASEAHVRALRRERGWKADEVILLYSGHIGRAHQVEGFARLAERIAAARIPARMVFCGDGLRKEAWARRLGASVDWLPPVASEVVSAHLLCADIHLISVQSAWSGIVVPSKYQSACALGRPVLYDGPDDSAVARWIREGNTGWLLAGGDAGMDAFQVETLRDRNAIAAKGANAFDQAVRLFDRDANVTALSLLIEQSVPGRTTAAKGAAASRRLAWRQAVKNAGNPHRPESGVA